MPGASSLDKWLERGKEVQIGPKTVTILPLPLATLIDCMDQFQITVGAALHTLQSDDPEPFSKLLVNTLRLFDTSELCLKLFSYFKDFEGKPINQEIDKAFLDQWLDMPTVRQIIGKFIEVNELAETLKNLEGLPGVSQLLETLTTSIGIGFLNSLRQNMGSLPGRSEEQPSPKSMDTTADSSSEPPANGPDSPAIPKTPKRSPYMSPLREHLI